MPMETKSLFVGIDCSLQQNRVGVLDAQAQVLVKPFSVANNQPGAEQLVAQLDALMTQHGADTLVMGTEATSLYDWHVLEYLAKSPLASKYTLQLYRLNAKLLHNFKKSLTVKTIKNDTQDCLAIAERLRFGHLPKPYQAEVAQLPLRQLTRFRFHLTHTLAREKNFFLTHLFLKFSAYTSLQPFSHTFSATSLAVISEFFSVDELAKVALPDLVDFLRQKGRNRFPDPERVAQTLQQVTRESYRLRPALLKSVNFILAASLATIRCLTEQVRQIDQAIAEHLKAFPQTLESVPGIGPVYAAGLLAEIGDIHRFPSQAHLASFASLTWSEYSSGDFQAEETPLQKAGNVYLRYYLVEAANLVRQRAPEYRQYYQRKYAEVTKHQHKRALVLTARKLVRLVYTLLATGKLYQPQEVIA